MIHFLSKNLIFSFAAILIAGCSAGIHSDQIFKEASSYLESNPQHTIYILQHNRNCFHSHSGKARYDLLMSMAMDKAYIDYTSDSLTSIALKYYRRHGSPDEKMRAYYYHSLVYHNRNDDDKAMEYLVKAEHLIPEAADHILCGQIYAACSAIYYRMVDIPNSLNYAKKAEEEYQLAGDGTRQKKVMLRLADCYMQANMPDSAEAYLSRFRQDMDSSCLNYYYTDKLVFDRYYNIQDIDLDLESYCSIFPENERDWKQIAGCFIATKDYPKALEAMNKYAEYDSTYRHSPAYYHMRSAILDSLGQFQQALTLHKTYVHLLDSMTTAIYMTDTKYMKERYEKDLSIKKGQIKILAISGTLTLISILFVFLSVHFRKDAQKKKAEKARLQKQYESMLEEKKNLESSLEDKEALTTEGQEIIQARCKLLDSILVSYINNNGQLDTKANKSITKALDDKHAFMMSIRSTLNILYPKFITELERRGLNENEIMICCMYGIGLSGKAIMGYTGNSNHYNECTAIRSKFNLTQHDTNIGIHIRSILSGLYPETNSCKR